MPDYKKKKHNKFFNPPAKASKERLKKRQTEERITMSPKKGKAEDKPEKDSVKIITGKKLHRKRRLKVTGIVTAAVVAILVIAQIILPAGLVTTLSNLTALIGAGNYPIEITEGSVIQTVSKGGYHYVLTSGNLLAFADSGKKLFEYYHGFESPVIKVSDSGAILFNQGSREIAIFNLRGFKGELETEKNIITAAFSDSGRIAVATGSDKYTSMVRVYSKNLDTVYEWFSSEGTVNNLALSANGRKLAVSCFYSENGVLSSDIRVLNFKSANPEFKLEYDDGLVYSLDSTHSGCFAAVTADKVQFVKWSDHKVKELESEYPVSTFRAGADGFVAVFNRESDKTDNRIAVFSRSGELKFETEFGSTVSDINVYAGHIYCLSGTEIYLLSKDSEVLRTASCGFGAVRLCVTDTNTVAVVTDNKIESIKLERNETK